jgi:hypothetical protein
MFKNQPVKVIEQLGTTDALFYGLRTLEWRRVTSLSDASGIAEFGLDCEPMNKKHWVARGIRAGILMPDALGNIPQKEFNAYYARLRLEFNADFAKALGDMEYEALLHWISLNRAEWSEDFILQTNQISLEKSRFPKPNTEAASVTQVDGSAMRSVEPTQVPTVYQLPTPAEIVSSLSKSKRSLS